MRALRQLKTKESPKTQRKPRRNKVKSHIIRVLKEWNEWEDIPGITVEFPKGVSRSDWFYIFISPQNGYWKGGTFKFEFKIPTNYPIDPPEVDCLTTPIYHPNIDSNGNVCLNILRLEWLPTNTINNVVYGLILLFEQPNFIDPLPSGRFPPDMEPFELWDRDETKFKEIVLKTMKGGQVKELGTLMFPSIIS